MSERKIRLQQLKPIEQITQFNPKQQQLHKVNQHKNQKKKKTVFPSNPGPNKHHTDSKVEITAFCQLGILEIQSLSIKTQKNQKKTEHSHTKKHKHNYLLAFKNKKKREKQNDPFVLTEMVPKKCSTKTNVSTWIKFMS